MQKIWQSVPLLVIILFVASCQSQVEQVKKMPPNKFSDDGLIEIYELIDQRKGDSLLNYLRHANDLYRYEAALGFGSIQDPAAIQPLSYALQDSSAKVRKAAAYSLGQIGDSSAIEPIVISLETEDSVYVRKELLESLGKVITQDSLSLLQYWPLKTQEDKEGLAWGLYRAGIRNVHDGISIDIALSLLDSSNSYLTRLGAAHFLYRSSNLDITGRTAFITRSALTDASPNVRMACALALRNAIEASSLNALKSLMSDPDYRVRVNALRAMTSFNIEETKESYLNALQDQNLNVRITAAMNLSTQSTNEMYDELNAAFNTAKNWRVKGALIGAILQSAEEKQVALEKIKSEYTATENPYYKAALLSSMGNSVMGNEFVITQLFTEKHPAITTSAISTLAQMRMSEAFPLELEASFAEVFKEAILSKDVAQISIASSVISQPNLKYNEIYDTPDFLYEAKANLTLPKDTEAMSSLNAAIAYLEGKDPISPDREYNNPINWELVKSIDKKTKAEITTEKGKIILELYIEDAPGSVSNFVKLAKSGYYNGKNFHRVVPNFVIQGGCNRGDGFGSEDYSIRSELANLRYEEGTVGMASSGKDTESTQWFITHSPTPHLDGSYTVFARVIEGMEVIHTIEIGDKITQVEIK
ncbi:peptidylprolyl isomerase [Fulvivirga lutea]|uniref:peptidylprolyl isomerase n=1 Tax=Fulvivirga lutea TaxID=2810512 RepID=A0A974WHQ2_9BACT|nr:peptidylprolyl isomerase [Fulvivirga lutea]QSE98104.1 peptidylprolyl isomerase [Fulvivirga lutea]